ncbi:hypothetical protein DEM28_11910 [Enterobacter mori]|nr:hypothetical protein DEM28_11910 [Enterobacter mori]
MNNETTLYDDNDAENTFEALAVDLLSGLLGAHDNAQNAELKDLLDSSFPVQTEVLLKHAEFICERFQAGDDSHLLMHGIDEQLAAMALSRKERFSPMNKGMVGYGGSSRSRRAGSMATPRTYIHSQKKTGRLACSR